MYKICVVGGWCGNRMVTVKDNIQSLLSNSGYPVKVTTHSVWENYSTSPEADLILQLLPAYKEPETGCPIINIKPFLLDPDDAVTTKKILDHIQGHFQNIQQMSQIL
jgi:galactitol-specific phosphotransferase system IIB component